MKHKGTKSYTAKVQSRHPTYLYDLYCYATEILGNSATFDKISIVMNQKSQAANKEREAITLNWCNLYCWFKKNGGKEKLCIKKPYLSDEGKKQNEMLG